MSEVFPEERFSEEELLAREDAQRRADEEEERLAFYGAPASPAYPIEEEPLPF